MNTWSQSSWDRLNPEWLGYPSSQLGGPAYVGQGCVPVPTPAMNAAGGGHPDVTTVTTEPQIQWWVEKIDAGERSERSMGPKSRCVGSMCPTNLGKTQSLRVSERKDEHGWRTHQSLPDVPRPLRHPSEICASMALVQLSATLHGIDRIRAVLQQSFQKAYEAVNKAAQAHEDFCKRTEKLKGVPGTLDAVKRAKICTRDVLLWRWFGLTAWIYNQAEAEFFQSYGREIESQLMNSVVKIRQRLMQDLMRRPCWRKLEKKLVNCAATDSWTPELLGLLNRFRFMFESLGGTRNPLLQEVRLSAEEERQMEQIEDEAKAKEEQELEAEFNEVWNNAGRKVSESVVGLLGLDDFDDIEPCDSPVCVGDPGLVAGQGFVDGFAALQRIWSELQEPSEMSEINVNVFDSEPSMNLS